MLKNKWIAEALWWLFCGIVCLLVLIPIYLKKIEFPFWGHNIYFIVCFITFVRWLFLWPTTPYAWNQWFKAIIIFLMIFILFFAYTKFQDFKIYMDDIGLQEMVKDLDSELQDGMMKYIRTEVVFFSSASIISGLVIPFKLIWSIWTQHNRNYV